MVPWCACSKRSIRRAAAPVNAPRSWPKSSLSSNVSGIEAQESLRARFNLDVRVNCEVTGIDRTQRLVKVRERISCREYEQPYDALIPFAGATPLLPPIPGIEREGHFTVRNIPDVEHIKAWIKECRVCSVVIVGGGYIGLEMAEQLVRHGGLSLTVVEALPQVTAPLDPEMVAWLHLELRKHGIDLFLGDPVAVSMIRQPVSQPARLWSLMNLICTTTRYCDLIIARFSTSSSTRTWTRRRSRRTSNSRRVFGRLREPASGESRSERGGSLHSHFPIGNPASLLGRKPHARKQKENKQ